MGIRTRRAHRHSRTHIVAFGFAGFLGFTALLVAALAISLGALVNTWLQDLPDYTSADAYLVSEPTTVYAADGSVIAEYYLQNRRSVDISEISPYVLEGVVDTEDVRFYQHHGVDLQGILRAVYVQLAGGSEGASTITQQLVRNTILSDEQFEMTLRRKVREAYLAIQMEKMYTKNQILNMYLNTIYFGHSAYGIEAAAKTYFNKDAKDLTLAEAATLAGLPQSPSSYDPFVNPSAATARRNEVLDHMLSQGDITQEEHDKAVAEPMQCNEGSFDDATGNYPYFSDYVKSVLLEDFSEDTVMKGGLKVYTTLDPATQEAAQNAVTSTLDDLGNDKLDSALVAVNPTNGYIVAMVGGRDYNTNQFNLATQARRQPGSSFKLFTLTVALANGMSPDIYINASSPMTFSSTWKVQNFGNESYGTITLRKAFAVSSNTAFVQVIQAVGADKVVSEAKDMGIDVDLPAYDSLTLGTVGVPPIQMAEAYATIATNGVHRDAIAITKILDRNGNTVYEHKDDPKQVVDAAVAQDVRSVMEGVVQAGGTASAVSTDMTVDQPVAGKTGTSEDYRDLWFCGITPQLSVSIWCGYREEAAVTINGAYGHPYTTSVPIFISFINQALAGQTRQEFPTTDEKATYKANGEWTFSKTSGTTSSKTYSYSNDDDEESGTDYTTTTTYAPSTNTNSGYTGNTGNGTTTTDTTADTGGTTGGGDTGGAGTTTGGDAGGATTGGGDTGGETGGGQ